MIIGKFADFLRLNKMKVRYLFILLICCALSSCGEYYKLQKSNDYDAKWNKANEYYDQGKYKRVIELMEELKAVYKGTERAEQCLYMLANSYYRTKDYYSAGAQYQLYYKTYPKGTFTEECRFMAGKSAFINSPDSRLSQEGTIEAMDELTVFLEYYPLSEHRDEAEEMLNGRRMRIVSLKKDPIEISIKLGSGISALHSRLTLLLMRSLSARK